MYIVFIFSASRTCNALHGMDKEFLHLRTMFWDPYLMHVMIVISAGLSDRVKSFISLHPPSARMSKTTATGKAKALPQRPNLD